VRPSLSCFCCSHHRVVVFSCSVCGSEIIMCCGEKKVDKRFARNVKKPSMFLSSLVVKRRSNRRASKPNMLLDAVLSNAINNIRNDKILSKLNTISKTKKFSTHDIPLPKSRRKIRNVSDVLQSEPEKKNDSYKCLLEVDNFFEELRNIKPSAHLQREVIQEPIVNYQVDDLRTSNESLNDSCSDIVDHFVETGSYDV